MGRKEIIDLMVEGGKASPGPTSAPRLSAMKVNIQQIFSQINEKTKEYVGMQVPVKIEIDTETKAFEIKVGIPPMSSLIIKEMGIEVAKITEEDKTKGVTSVGNLNFDQVLKIAKIKQSHLLSKNLKSAVKVVLGTANSMTGVLVENKRPKEVIKEVDEGKYDNLLK
jgi:large subunit ribosomal protein L11